MFGHPEFLYLAALILLPLPTRIFSADKPGHDRLDIGSVTADGLRKLIERDTRPRDRTLHHGEFEIVARPAAVLQLVQSLAANAGATR